MTALAYLGRKDCGCAVVALLDQPARPEEVAIELKALRHRGLVIEQVPATETREALSMCTHLPGTRRS